jgi:hypothetical protein
MNHQELDVFTCVRNDFRGNFDICNTMEDVELPRLIVKSLAPGLVHFWLIFICVSKTLQSPTWQPHISYSLHYVTEL